MKYFESIVIVIVVKKKNLIKVFSFPYSYVLIAVKKNKFVSCPAPGCTNLADKNSNIITVNNNNNVIITILQHIKNLSVFNA